ncbi:unnamed protein product [Owenia fusiformis]|uniref:FAD-binding FR-type domain-containing protein n=1 Tax=Owenia fusiformis TaxID=6347 RepID=A0A8J1XVP2_OWEFU|nr:unnamed protein product [Owenia fusiformis]
MAEGKKAWGKTDFWGIGYEYDPQWYFTKEQQQLQVSIIELCRTTLRPNAIKYDKTYEFPRDNINALATLGLLGLIIPKELGGLGESHVCAAMVVETIARYGCPSTAMVYVMHSASLATLLLRYHNNNTIKDLLRRVNKDRLLGTLMYSDPATGGHFWFPLSSKAVKMDDGRFQVLKSSSWTTSAGFADFYCAQTASPGFGGDYSNLSVFLLFKNEVRSNTDDWSALGMHGNQSGPIMAEGILHPDRLVGPIGDGRFSNDECVDPWFLLLSSSVWNGISMGCIDIAKKHTTQKRHADVGLRVSDYPTIQDYFGDCISKTNSCRLSVMSIASGMDRASNNNDWSKHSDLKFDPRTSYLHWGWQLKFNCGGNVAYVGDTMLRTCGGAGFKTDLGLERLLRDGKAGWVMGPSGEVTRGWVGKSALNGMDTIDYWSQTVNHRAVHTELKKMSPSAKQALVDKLMKDLAMEESNYNGENLYQGSEFDNPFNTCPPEHVKEITVDNVTHKNALNPDEYVECKIKEWQYIADNIAEFTIDLPESSQHTGCLPGQYVKVAIASNGHLTERYFSPTTCPSTFGSMQLVTKLESHGEFSNMCRSKKPGDSVKVKGPCGGLEYKPNKLDRITLITSGIGVTPALQIIRSIMANPDDKTKVTLISYADEEPELLYKDELDGYSKSGRFTALYSLGTVDEKWTGAEGYIDGEMIKKMVPKMEGSQKIVICGGPSMVITVVEFLNQMEYDSSEIFIFGTFGVNQLRSVYGPKTKLSTHLC